MPTVTRFSRSQNTVSVVASDRLGPKAQSAAIAAFARKRLAAAEAQNRKALGEVPKHRSFVDGRAEAPLESVKPNGGRIVFVFEMQRDVLRWIFNTLVERSPELSGEYKRSHMIFVDGVEVSGLADLPVAEEYVFMNPVPYSRKVEIGKTKAGRDFLLKVPNRIYERTAKDAQRRFGNIARVKFSYRSPILPYVAMGGRKGGSAASAAKRSAAGMERTTRFPSIIVTLR